MPIYAYRCESCGHAQDSLQKMSDPVLIQCPACGAPSLKKQVTAAGFQLKGTGWYVTDFRGGNSAAPADSADPADSAAPKDDVAPAAAAPSVEAPPAAAAPLTPASSPSPAPAPTAKPSGTE